MSAKLNLTRQQLSTFLKDPEIIKKFEQLFFNVAEVIPGSQDSNDFSSSLAQQQAAEALAGLASIAEQLSFILSSPFEQQQLPDIYAPPIQKELFENNLTPAIIKESFDLYLPPVSYGSMADQNANNVAITGGSIAITEGVIKPGSYTPTLINVANLSASTAYVCQYLQVGNVITVSGKADVDPILPGTITQLGISLPVNSNLVAQEQCAGVASASDIGGQSAAILGDAVNNRAEMKWLSSDISNQAMYFTFTYKII